MIKRIISIITILAVIVGCMTACHKKKQAETVNVITDAVESMPQQSSSCEIDDELPSEITWPCIYIKNATASVSEKEVSIAVLIMNNPGIAGALLRFYYDNRLSLIDAQPGKAFSSLDYTPPGEYLNPCSFNWDSESGMTSDDGTILILTFKLPEVIHVGENFEIKCSFRDSDVYDENLNNVSVGTESGTIIIK